MMMPTLPVANFVVGQTRFAFAAFDTLLDAMSGFGDAGEFAQWRVGRRVGKIVIDLRRAFLVDVANSLAAHRIAKVLDQRPH